MPAHTTILTGLNPPEHGVRNNGTFVLAQETTTLAEVLREHGFDYLVNDSRPSRSKWRDRFAAGGFQTVPGRDPMQAVEVRAEVVESEASDAEGGTHTLRETLIFCRSAGRRHHRRHPCAGGCNHLHPCRYGRHARRRQFRTHHRDFDAV